MRSIALVIAALLAAGSSFAQGTDDKAAERRAQMAESQRRAELRSRVDALVLRANAGDLPVGEAEKEIAEIVKDDPEILRSDLIPESAQVDLARVSVAIKGQPQAVKDAEEQIRSSLGMKRGFGAGCCRLPLLILLRYGDEEDEQSLREIMRDDSVLYGMRFAAARALALDGAEEFRAEILAFLASIPSDERARWDFYQRGAAQGSLSYQDYADRYPKKFAVHMKETSDTENEYREALCALDCPAAQEVLAKALGTHPIFPALREMPQRPILYMAESAPDLLLPYLESLLDPECEEDCYDVLSCHFWAFDILLKYYADRLPKEWFEKKFAACFYDMDNPESSPRYKDLRPGTDTYSWAGEPIAHIAETIRNMKAGSPNEGASAPAADDPQPDGDDASASRLEPAAESAE